MQYEISLHNYPKKWPIIIIAYRYFQTLLLFIKNVYIEKTLQMDKYVIPPISNIWDYRESFLTKRMLKMFWTDVFWFLEYCL